MSKTSQKKAPKVTKQKAAAEKTASKRAPKAEYSYKPIPASFKGSVHKVQTNGKVVSPVHIVEDGSTRCGYSTTEQSKGDKHYELQFVETNEKVTCKRCLAEPKASANGKKPTPISKAKAKKAKK